MRKSKAFKDLVQRVLDECERRDFATAQNTVEELLHAQVTLVARSLRISERSVLTNHGSAFDPARVVSMLQEAKQRRVDRVASTPHAILSLAEAGQVVASLGQVVRFVSLNHERLTGPNKWDCIGILDGAGDAISDIGLVLASMTDKTDVVLLPDEAVVNARQALHGAVSKLAGSWTMFDDYPDLDAAILERMRRDLAILPPVADLS